MSWLLISGIVVGVVAVAAMAMVWMSQRRTIRLGIELHARYDEDRRNRLTAAADDLIYGRTFVDASRYASVIVVVGRDPDCPDVPRVKSFQREQIGDGPFWEPLEPCDIADCLRVHADDLEAGVA